MKLPDWWPCYFWDTKINNPFWKALDWVLLHFRLWDLWDWIRGNDEEE